MGLAWQQGPLAVNTVGHFLTPEPLPPRLLFADRADRCGCPDGNRWVRQERGHR